MSTLTSTRPTQLPRVNLLPPEIAADRRFRSLQIGLGVAVLAAFGVIALVFLGAAAAKGNAEAELEASQARQLALQREIAQYHEVPAVFAQVAKAETQLKTAMGREVRWSYVLNDLGSRVPDDVGISRIEISQPTVSPAFTTVSGVETGGAIIANISFSGHTLTAGRNGSRENVADFADSLAKQKTYANPYFTMSELVDVKKSKIVKFDMTVDVNEQALSRRYTSEKVK